MHTVVSVKNPIGSAIGIPTSSAGLARAVLTGGRQFLHVTGEGLALVDRDVGIRDESGELVGGVPRDEALIAPVKRHADVVDGAAGDRERAHPPRDEGLAADAAA